MKKLLANQSFAIIAALVAGCDGRGVSGAGETACDGCQHSQYVVSSLQIPAQGQAMRMGCDLDGDGQVDNALGRVLAGLPSVDPQFNFQQAANDAFANGTLVLLLDLGYTPDFQRSTAAELTIYQGRHDPSDGLRAPDFYAGGGHFFIAGPGAKLGGAVSAGWADFDGARYSADLPMPMAQPAALDLVRGRAQGVVTASTIEDGVLCGAIPVSELRDRVIPAVADMLSAAVKSGNTTLKGLFDADHSCDHEAACVVTDPGLCHCISAQEFESTQFVHLLDPDLDLDPAVDNPFATGPDDPARHNDALSFGFGFTARSAHF
jgi:hypothetical protein